MGTQDDAREGGSARLIRHLRRSRYTANLASALVGALCGFYLAVAFYVEPLRHGSGDATLVAGGLSRWRDLEPAAPEAEGGGAAAAARRARDKGSAECPPCPACPGQAAPADGDADEPQQRQEGAAAAGAGAFSVDQGTLEDQMGLEFLGVVDGKRAFDEFFQHVPQNIRETTYPMALAMSTGRGRMRQSGREGREVTPLEDLGTCTEVDVLQLASGRCYLAVNSRMQFASYFVQRYKKADADADADGWKMVPRIEKEGSYPPLPINRHKHERFLRTLLDNFRDLEAQATKVLRKAADKHGNRVVVMAVNEGDTDMLANFVCSARLAEIDISNVIVFGADESATKVAESLGLLSFTHPAFGELPSAHSKHYGDAGFLAMMWLKIVSVWIAVRLGFDVLFQDADLVWFRPPWEAFEDPAVDGFFMDDGARSERFAPLYANSGFYFLRSNPVVNHFMQTVLFSYDMIVQYASHQTLFIQALQEHISRNAMTVRLLPSTDFMGGQVFHHRKDLMQQVVERSLPLLPYTFHMCWTQTKEDKLRNMLASNLWFLGAACNGSDATVKTLHAGELSPEACCLDPMASPAAASRRE